MISQELQNFLEGKAVASISTPFRHQPDLPINVRGVFIFSSIFTSGPPGRDCISILKVPNL